MVDNTIFKEGPQETEGATMRVYRSMDSIINRIYPQLGECQLRIYFIPMFNISHCVISDRYMAFRSTNLWTKNDEHKGSYLVCRKPKDIVEKYVSEFKAMENYIKALISNSIKLNLDDTIFRTTPEEYTAERQKELRAETKRFLDRNPDANISLHKAYLTHVDRFVRTHWENERDKPRFRNSEDIVTRENLFDPKNFLDDCTQQQLLPYLKGTEQLFKKVLEFYTPTADSSDVQIYPSLDLGIPNNVQRLAGGFGTGMFITWDCGIPIIPIDATVNVCSSSVFRLGKKPKKKDNR